MHSKGGVVLDARSELESGAGHERARRAKVWLLIGVA